MLFVHEVHHVAGAREDEFDAAYRDGWVPAVASSGARLLWFLRLAHGSGAAYTVVTVTGMADANAWEDLAARLRVGDLRDWSSEVDAMRHRHEAKALVPVEWSPLQDVELSAAPITPTDHEPALFMEDTAWPFAGRLQDYLKAAGDLYQETLRRSAESGRSILRLEAAFQPAFGTHRTTEVVLWQRVVDLKLLQHLLMTDTPASMKQPGGWMHEALQVRDQWESRLLRTARWSPLA